MAKIALFGGTGSIGNSVASALRAQGRNYRVVGRSMPGLEAEYGSDPLAELVTWNPSDPSSIRAAARDVDTIIYLVGVPYTDFHLHPILMRRTLEAAIAEGVPRILLIGTVYPFGLPRTTPLKEDHPREPNSFKGRMRKEQEDVLLDADAKGSIRATVLRLPDFYGPGVTSSFLYDAFLAAIERRRAKMIGPIDAPHEFVYVPDVGPVAVALADEPRAYGRTWNFAGAGVTTQRKMVELIFREAGSEPKVMEARKLMLRVMGIFSPFMRELVEMHYLQTNPILMDDSDLRSLLGHVRKTPYEEGVRQTLRLMSEPKNA